MHSEIDLSKPREVSYQSFVGRQDSCPQCGGRLRPSTQTYAVSTRRGRKQLDSFVMSSDFGWFCDTCPIVLINSHKVSELLGYSMSHWDVGNKFCVEGIIDLEAIPKDKLNSPIGDADTPMPLVQFQEWGAPTQRKPLNRQQRQKRKKRLERKLKAGGART